MIGSDDFGESVGCFHTERKHKFGTDCCLSRRLLGDAQKLCSLFVTLVGGQSSHTIARQSRGLCSSTTCAKSLVQRRVTHAENVRKTTCRRGRQCSSEAMCCQARPSLGEVATVQACMSASRATSLTVLLFVLLCTS